jgi:uncharacterized protein
MINLNERLNKSILDPIHGLIRMTEEEMSIISHELFNRLRRIKQNTFLYYVFPSANHSRFEHSIGVMHLASEMYLNAFQNANTLKQKRKKYGLEDTFNILCLDDFKEFEEVFWDLRIAALLHDIGHGPMSHLFDEFAVSNNNFIDLIKKDKSLHKDGDNLGIELADSIESILKSEEAMEKKVEHEYVSYYFTLIVLAEIGLSNQRIRNILSIMNHKLNMTQINTKPKDTDFYQVLPLLNHIVAGAPLDCDRMDYLLRDSYFSGVKYGTYDLNRLLKSLLPYIDKDKKSIRLGIKKSGLPAIENFLQARYELYIQVYFHKTNQACNTMLSHATRNLEKLSFLNFENPEELRARYLELSDENFLRLVKSDLEQKNNEKDAKIMDDLLNRRLWKRVLEIHPEKGKERKEDLDTILKNSTQWILNNYPHLEAFLRENFITTNPVKDLDKEKAVLLVKDEDENYFIGQENDWVSESIIFKALSSRYMIGRIYMQVEPNNQENKDTFRNIKKEIQKFL